MEKNLQDALAQGNQQEAEEARKILAQETLKLEEKAESEKKKSETVKLYFFDLPRGQKSFV